MLLYPAKGGFVFLFQNHPACLGIIPPLSVYALALAPACCENTFTVGGESKPTFSARRSSMHTAFTVCTIIVTHSRTLPGWFTAVQKEEAQLQQFIRVQGRTTAQ